MPEPTLDPKAQDLLDRVVAAGGPPVSELPVAEVRRLLREVFVTDAPVEQVAAVGERELASPRGSFPVRLYRPGDGTLPLVVFFHGGGWCLNDLDTHDGICRRLANACAAMVISVGLRRSPEYPYPTQVEDCFLATAWAAQHAATLGVDPDRIGVVGDSSGGMDAAAVALLARDRGFPALRMQGLVYPVTDAPSRARPSYVERGSGYMLDAATMDWFWDMYVGALDHVDLDDPYLCPLRAADCSGLPGGFVVTAEFDPLRDEGRAYAERLRQAGCDVAYRNVGDLMHNFMLQAGEIPRADEEVAWIAGAIRQHLGG